MVFSNNLKIPEQERMVNSLTAHVTVQRKDQDADRYENDDRPICPYPTLGTFSVFPILSSFILPALLYSQHAKKSFF
jgi:hypothetical protein